MATATLKKRERKTKTPAWPASEELEEDRSASFFMPAGSMTLEDFRKWTSADDFPETGKIAYIGKEIFIDMSPEGIDSHAAVKVEICTALGSLIRKKKLGRLFFDRTRVVHTTAVVSNEPDAFIATYATLKSGSLKRIRTPAGDDYIEFEGTPDWIMEIVSSSSVTKDKKKLRKRYYRAGVSEYWLIDARGKEVDFQILMHGKEDYELAGGDDEWQASKVFGKKFRLRRITDELGDVDYRLDMK